VVRSAFKGFDDGFSDFAVSQQAGVGSEGGAWPSQTPKKRSPPSSPPPSSDNDDTLFPAAAAMKRRRMQEGGTPSRSLEPDASASPKKSPRVKKELDIAATVLERRKAQDAEKQHEEQALQQSLSDLSFEKMNKLARVEEMEVPERKPRSSRFGGGAGGAGEAGGEQSQRWDPAWNGRKNFKRFRRQGTNQELRRGQTVIVPLEEVQKRTMGIGEHYWLEPTSSRQTSSRQAATRPQISRQISGRTEREAGSRRQLTRENSENSDDAVSQSRQTFASARSQLGERAEHGDQEVVEIPKELADLNDSQVVDVEEPRLTRRREKEQEHEQAGGNAGTTTSRAGTKRSAQSQVARGGSKRQKTTTTAASRGGREDGEGDESDSDDGLKFRIRRRKG
jgi:nibrin